MAKKKSGSATIVGTSAAKGGTAAQTADTATSPAAVPAATEFESSGAPIQPSTEVDPTHAAVDDNPRAGTSVEQNRIDFNDPTLSGAEAVAKNLKDGEAKK